MKQYESLNHIFDPIYNNKSKILILGTFPSVKSRENDFYYGHPRNRFWKLISLITDEATPDTIGEKKELLLRNNIAIWDVIKSCDIVGSSDSSIKNVMPADLTPILQTADIQQIYGNGGKAYQLYYKYTYPSTGKEMIVLPSTSPANAAYSIEKLETEWSQIKKFIT